MTISNLVHTVLHSGSFIQEIFISNLVHTVLRSASFIRGFTRSDNVLHLFTAILLSVATLLYSYNVVHAFPLRDNFVCIHTTGKVSRNRKC